VVDENNELQGIIHMDSIRSIIFNPEKHQKIRVKDLMGKPAAIIKLDENLHEVLKKFDDTNQWNLPVISEKKYMGFVSKSSVLTRYRSELLKSI
jgi:CIC family chloride channel protein